MSLYAGRKLKKKKVNIFLICKAGTLRTHAFVVYFDCLDNTFVFRSGSSIFKLCEGNYFDIYNHTVINFNSFVFLEIRR